MSITLQYSIVCNYVVYRFWNILRWIISCHSKLNYWSYKVTENGWIKLPIRIFRYLIKSPGDLTKADDLEWPLKIISGTRNGFVVCVKKYSICSVRSQQQLSDIICEQLFMLSYSTRKTVIWCRAWSAGDSWVSCSYSLLHLNTVGKISANIVVFSFTF